MWSRSRRLAAYIIATGTRHGTPQGGPLYSYCSVFAFPKRAGGSQHYYLTPLFASEPSARPADAFQISIRGAHPDESVQSAYCTPPKPMSDAQAQRQRDLDAKRHNKANTVVEVNWKPGT